MQVPVSSADPTTVRDVALAIPTGLLEKFHIKRARTVELKVLDSISGTLVAGRMTLIIGHPGSGKSSLLRALAGRLANPSLLKGEIRYNGFTAAELNYLGVQFQQMAQYVSQIDEHSPFLTVRETLRFVARNVFPTALADERVAEVIDLLRLQDCADMVIGSTMRRGISGGELKRVTVGEGLLTNARILALDEITTGEYYAP